MLHATRMTDTSGPFAALLRCRSPKVVKEDQIRWEPEVQGGREPALSHPANTGRCQEPGPDLVKALARRPCWSWIHHGNRGQASEQKKFKTPWALSPAAELEKCVARPGVGWGFASSSHTRADMGPALFCGSCQLPPEVCDHRWDRAGGFLHGQFPTGYQTLEG